jgi:Uma2 family endonuclease
MTTSQIQVLTLEEFLKQPYIEDSPAWEYMDGDVSQKPMPKTRHSILQKRLLVRIDDRSKDYTALPELRCTFAGRSIVPDIAVVAWDRIPVNELGEPEDNFMEAPDWAIEILSPANSQLLVIDGVNLTLTAAEVFAWLQIGNR